MNVNVLMISFLLEETKSKNMHTGGIMHTLHSAYFKGFFMHILKKLYAAYYFLLKFFKFSLYA